MRGIKALVLIIGIFLFSGSFFVLIASGSDSEAQAQSAESSRWGTDITVCRGPVEGGIAAAHDSDYNLYAARCNTYEGRERNSYWIYKSTDNGMTWQLLARRGWLFGGTQVSHPQLVTCHSGDEEYLLLFYLFNVWDDVFLVLSTMTTNGVGVGVEAIAEGDITYFSVCSTLDGDSLLVVYQKHSLLDETPNVRSIRSTDQGVTWIDDMQVAEDGQHPDVAYGMDGYVYLVYGTTQGNNLDIGYSRSTDFGGSWSSPVKLIDDSWDDDYPKVAALHTIPADSATVWVSFNHDFGNSGDIDVRYVYSTNSGADWSVPFVMAQSSDHDEQAADLIVARSTENTSVYASFLKSRFRAKPPPIDVSDIYVLRAGGESPDSWYALTKINDHRAAFSPDGREVCQGIIMSSGPLVLLGYVYAGQPAMFEDFENLYFDVGYSTEVEGEEGEGVHPADFSLSDNYPNPFNPETKISYLIPAACHVRLEIFNILSQKVRTLVDEGQAAGEKSATWDGKDEGENQVASGVYLYRLQAGDFAETKKMVLMR